jgi:hypothetical protein
MYAIFVKATGKRMATEPINFETEIAAVEYALEEELDINGIQIKEVIEQNTLTEWERKVIAEKRIKSERGRKIQAGRTDRRPIRVTILTDDEI